MTTTTVNNCNIQEYVYKLSDRGSTVYLNGPPIQLPRSRAPFGVSTIGFDGKPTSRPNLELNVTDEETIDLLSKFDAQNISKLCEQSLAWLKRTTSESDVKSRYRASLKTSEKYAPRLRVKLSERTKVWTMDAEGNRHEVTVEDVTRNSEVICIVKPSIWIFGKQLGMSLSCTHMLIYPKADDDDIFNI